MNKAEEAQLNMEVERGARAERIMRDSLVQEALDLIDAAITEKWKTSPIRDTEGQMMLRMQMQAAQQFRKFFEDAVTTGKLASTGLEHERTLRDRVKAGVHAFRR